MRPYAFAMPPAPWTSGLVELAFDEPRPMPRPGCAMLKRVAAREDWAAARALRFAAMVREGDVAPSALPTSADPLDGAAGSATFLLMEQGRVLGSTRCNHSGPASSAPLAAAQAFAAEIGERAARAPVVEASFTVVDRAADRASALMRLFKAHTTACAAVDAEWLVAAVAERQMGFYRRVFDMEILSGALPVRGFALPRVLMGLRFRERAALLYRRLPFLAPSGEDLRRYACGAELPLDRDEGGSIAARRRSAAGDARA